MDQPKILRRIPIGLRTLKTVIAVVISMVLVGTYGATASRLTFAMLGAMAAVMPTFKASVESCLTQIVGVLFGSLMGVFLLRLPFSPIAASGIGIALVITLYNTLRIRFSPSLPCIIVVMLCITPDIQPIPYALGRIWDTAIGLGVGMLINMLVFPYDNRSSIRAAMESLDREVLLFLEDVFDGDGSLPDTEKLDKEIGEINRQLQIFENQRLPLAKQEHSQSVKTYRIYAEKAHYLVAHMAVLSRMGRPGCLSDKNRRRLEQAGASIRDKRQPTVFKEKDVITNYHVEQILTLRQELLQALDHNR